VIEMDDKLSERLAVLEALLRDLTLSNKEEHQKLSGEIKRLDSHVNEEIDSMEERIEKLEIEGATSSVKWSVLKGTVLFLAGAFISLLVSILKGVI